MSNDDGAEFEPSPRLPGTILQPIPEGNNSTSDQVICARPPELGTSADAPSIFIHNPAILGSGVELLDNVTSPSLDEFHNSSFLSRTAILGDDFPELDHTHPDRQTHEFTISETDLKVLHIHGVFDLPRLAVRQRFLEAVVEFCWTWMPVLDFDATSSESSFAASPKATSILLLQTLMLVGSYMTEGQHISTFPAVTLSSRESHRRQWGGAQSLQAPRGSLLDSVVCTKCSKGHFDGHATVLEHVRHQPSSTNGAAPKSHSSREERRA